MMIESTHSLDAVLTFPDETSTRKDRSFEGNYAGVSNVAAKPTALSSKFYSHNS